MAKRVAVITDATSPDYWFPVWHKYYGTALGTDALYVLTYEGLRNAFKEVPLGGVWEIPHKYDDALRAKLISSLVSTLLITHNVVVRCDVDEFLIPDPRRYNGLRDYIENLDGKYATAIGVDVFERTGEAPIEMASPVLGSQRKYGVVASALHKTCITTIPAVWGAGFHGCSLYPTFKSLYMFHMKFADISRRIYWHDYMLDQAKKGGREETYYSDAASRLERYQAWLSTKKCHDGWKTLDNQHIAQRFLGTVKHEILHGQHNIYLGEFFNEEFAFEIPPEFSCV